MLPKVTSQWSYSFLLLFSTVLGIFFFFMDVSDHYNGTEHYVHNGKLVSCLEGLHHMIVPGTSAAPLKALSI